MSLTKATYSMIDGACVNVLDFGADPTGATDSTTAIANAIAAGQRIEFPPGVYQCNILLENVSSKYLVGQTQAHSGTNGALLIPADNTKPVIEVGGSGFAISVVIENFCFDSEISGSQANYTHTGVALRVKANNPNFVWKSAFRKLFIRGFEDGLVIDCDVNLSEVFDNDFQDIECIGISRFSFKTRGVYNRFGKLFATQVGIAGGSQPSPDYAIFHDGSQCFFDSMVSDGRQRWEGTGNFVANATIEAIHGPGDGTALADAMRLSGTNRNTWQNVTLTGIPGTKFDVGCTIFGESHYIGTIKIQGGSIPTGLRFLSSSGVMVSATQPNTGAKAPFPNGWSFLGDVSRTVNGGGEKPLNWVFQEAWDGTSFIVPAGTRNLVLDPNASPLASGDLTMPQSGGIPANGTTLTISTTKTITSMIFRTTGIYSFYTGSQTITQAFNAGESRSFIFRLADFKWYPN
jgi:hypothetical protein